MAMEVSGIIDAEAVFVVHVRVSNIRCLPLPDQSDY